MQQDSPMSASAQLWRRQRSRGKETGQSSTTGFERWRDDVCAQTIGLLVSSIRARDLCCGLTDLLRASELEGFGLLDFPRTEQRLIVCLYGGEISSERGEDEDRLRLD